jgi:hypothetical protein
MPPRPGAAVRADRLTERHGISAVDEEPRSAAAADELGWRHGSRVRGSRRILLLVAVQQFQHLRSHDLVEVLASGAGSTVTLVSWSSGMKRLWDTYVSVCASSNTNYGTLQTGYFLASIIDADDNIYASTLVRITGPDQTVSNAIPFDGKGFELAGPNSLSVMVTDAINDVNCSASGGVMIST